MTKVFVLDTSVLLSAGRTALYSFGNNDVVLPLVVIRELEAKRDDPTLGLPARSVLRTLDMLRVNGDLRKGVSLGEDYGTVRIETNHITDTPESLKSYPTNDTKIITVAYALGKELKEEVVLVSKDLALKLFASIAGVSSQDFVPANISGDFIDKTEIFKVSGDVIDSLHANKQIILDLDVPRNAGVLLQNELDENHSALVIQEEGWRLRKISNHKIKGLESRSAEQAIAIDYLMNPNVKIVSLGGRAGTGKTTLALAAAIEQYEKGLYKKIIVFRSMHSVGGEDLGFLPGTEAEKMDPWTKAIYASLESFMDTSKIKYLQQKQAIEVLPLTHIRGMTYNSSFILIDEAQNLERSVIMTALTRLGQNSKAVMSWDVSQRDNFRVGRHDGIYEVVNRLIGEKLFAHTSLQKSERSDVAELVARALDDFEL